MVSHLETSVTVGSVGAGAGDEPVNNSVLNNRTLSCHDESRPRGETFQPRLSLSRCIAVCALHIALKISSNNWLITV